MKLGKSGFFFLNGGTLCYAFYMFIIYMRVTFAYDGL